jgi:hypothetical protein
LVSTESMESRDGEIVRLRRTPPEAVTHLIGRRWRRSWVTRRSPPPRVESDVHRRVARAAHDAVEFHRALGNARPGSPLHFVKWRPSKRATPAAPQAEL